MELMENTIVVNRSRLTHQPDPKPGSLTFNHFRVEGSDNSEDRTIGGR